jgi:hypothetical protein
MTDLLSPRRNDLLDLADIVNAIPQELDDAKTGAKVKRIARRVRNVTALYDRYRDRSNDSELAAFAENLRYAATLCAAIDPATIDRTRLDTLHPDDRAKVLAVEAWELRSALRAPPGERGGGIGNREGIPDETNWKAILQALRLWIKKLKWRPQFPGRRAARREL